MKKKRELKHLSIFYKKSKEITLVVVSENVRILFFVFMKKVLVLRDSEFLVELKAKRV